MKKLIAMIALGALVTGSTYAQTTPQKDRKPRTERSAKGTADKKAMSPEERAAKRTEMMTKKYNLSVSQQAKLNALHASKKNEVAVNRSKGQRGTEMSQEQRQAMKENRDQYHAQLKAILTPAQYAQFEADRKSKKDGDHKGKRRGGTKRTGEKKEMKS